MANQQTLRLSITPDQLSTPASKRAIQQAAGVLQRGGTVAFPTETVYGLGANALDPQAVEKIFLAKQRPAWDPLIVHVADTSTLATVVAAIPDRAQPLMDAFWPGPLTLLLPRTEAIPSLVTAGRPLVGVRMPAHPVAHALLLAAAVPVAAPSANRFGHTSPTTSQHVLDDLDGVIDVVLDGGPTLLGVESTVIEVTDAAIILYRPGGVSAAAIEAVAGPVEIYRGPSAIGSPSAQAAAPQSMPSPGVGIRHYAPKARVIAVEVDGTPGCWLQVVQEECAAGVRVGVMLPSGWPLPEHFKGVRFDWGAWPDDQQLAQRLFAGLRSLDAMGVELILCPLPSPERMGAAVRDRLIKAAWPPIQK